MTALTPKKIEVTEQVTRAFTINALADWHRTSDDPGARQLSVVLTPKECAPPTVVFIRGDEYDKLGDGWTNESLNNFLRDKFGLVDAPAHKG